MNNFLVAVSCNSLNSCKPTVEVSESRMKRPNSYVMATDSALPDPNVNMDRIFSALSESQDHDRFVVVVSVCFVIYSLFVLIFFSVIPYKSMATRRAPPQTQHARIQKFINFFSSAGDKVL